MFLRVQSSYRVSMSKRPPETLTLNINSLSIFVFCSRKGHFYTYRNMFKAQDSKYAGHDLSLGGSSGNLQ